MRAQRLSQNKHLIYGASSLLAIAKDKWLEILSILGSPKKRVQEEDLGRVQQKQLI
jgi:hypothetical protein